MEHGVISYIIKNAGAFCPNSIWVNTAQLIFTVPTENITVTLTAF